MKNVGDIVIGNRYPEHTFFEMMTSPCGTIACYVYADGSYCVCKRVYYGRAWHDYTKYNDIKKLKLSVALRCKLQDTIDRIRATLNCI